MSQRFKAAKNVNESKNTRLAIAEEFMHYRFGRDQLAHVSRYLFICERLVELAKKRKRPLALLDIGCGDVYIPRVLNASFVVKKTDIIKRYVGLDIDNKILSRAEPSKPKSISIELICDDITTGALERFGDDEFDVVVCTEVIEHIKPEFVPLLLREVERIGRMAFISTPNLEGGTGRIPQDHIKEWGYDELHSVMLSCGLDVLQEIGIFCNLTKVRRIAKQDKRIASVLAFLEPRMDKDFLSLAMARFIGVRAQNILYVCACGN